MKHPALEVVITTDEEVGLLGAKALDCSQLKGKYLINMDSEEEGYLWVSCAGGLSAITTIPVRYQEVSGEKYELVISGLNGGHSGAEIDKNRANSNKLIGQALFTLEQDIPFCLTALEGGTKDNAIPRLSKAVFVADKEAEEAIFAAAEKLQNDWFLILHSTITHITYFAMLFFFSFSVFSAILKNTRTISPKSCICPLSDRRYL